MRIIEQIRQAYREGKEALHQGYELSQRFSLYNDLVFKKTIEEAAGIIHEVMTTKTYEEWQEFKTGFIGYTIGLGVFNPSKKRHGSDVLTIMDLLEAEHFREPVLLTGTHLPS